MPAGAAAAGDERFFQHHHGKACFDEFDRGVGGAGRPDDAGFAVLARRAALSAADENMVGEHAAAGVAAVEVDQRRQPRERLHLVGNCAAERAEDGADEIPHAQPPQPHRGRARAVEQAALGRGNGERAIAAGGGANAGREHAFQREHGFGPRNRQRAVDAAASKLLRRAVVIDLDFVVGNGQLQRHPQLFAGRVEMGEAAIDPIGHLANGLAHRRLAAPLHHRGQLDEIMQACTRP